MKTPEKTNKVGVITIAFGKRRYLKQAEALAHSLRYNMPDMPIALVSDIAEDHPLFDHTIPIDLSRGYGVLQKAWLNDYSPFEESLFIDSDCLVTRPFHKELAEISRRDFTPAMGRYFLPPERDDFYFEDFEKTLEKLNIKRFPKFNGGIYFFKRNDKADAVFNKAREIAQKGPELGLKIFDGGTVADETVIGLAMEVLGIDDLYYDQGNLMRSLIDSKGPVEIDVLGGGCHFIKGKEDVTPAICHFAAPYAYYAPYFYHCFVARHPHAPTFVKEMARLYYRGNRKIVNSLSQK